MNRGWVGFAARSLRFHATGNNIKYLVSELVDSDDKWIGYLQKWWGYVLCCIHFMKERDVKELEHCDIIINTSFNEH